MTSDESPPLDSFELNGVEVLDTFAEAFSIQATRLVITAVTREWARIAAMEFCGNATSLIGCDIEAGIEREISDQESPDGRPGVSVLAFAFSVDDLAKALQTRIGQCILTCATTACYSGILDGPKEKQISIGGNIRYFGDGFQKSKKLGNRRFWRIPVMDGEFLCEDRFGTVTGVAGGNLLICGSSVEAALGASEAAMEAIRSGHDVILPFPGINRSGSKVGSRYARVKASTNDAYCPTLRCFTPTKLSEQSQAGYEIVIDGLSYDAVQSAMKRGLHAASRAPGVSLIAAGNYGGKLGKQQFHLRDLVDAV